MAATIKSTLTLYDNMSASLNKINSMVQKTTATMSKLQNSMVNSSVSNIKAPNLDVSKPTQQAAKLQETISKPIKGPEVDMSKGSQKIQEFQESLKKQATIPPVKGPDVDISRGTQQIKLLENALLSAKNKFDSMILDPKVSADSALAASNKVNRLEKQLESAKSSMQGISPVASSAGKSISEMGDKAEKTGNLFKTVLGAGVISAGIQKGMGVITGSIDSAVSRFDTLNQYPKVMQQMGYSSQDAGEAVNVMKDGIDGLPTSLDDITKSAQSFAILEKNATKGAKVATSLNHAFLASGSSGADAARGVEQYSQMLAAGKVDAQAWRTIQETMPYALTKVANSFGLTGKSAEKDLYAKLESGKITMDQLNDRFIELDGGASGFANTAKVASAGIGTSMTNMKLAVTKGIADTVKSIDNGLKKAGTGGIASLMDKGKDAISQFFKTFNSALESGLPKVTKFLSDMKPVIDIIGQIVIAAGPVAGVMLAASGGFLAFNKALGGMKGALSVVATHPFIAAIFAIGTALVWAYKHIDWFKKGVDSTYKFLEKHSDVVGKTLPIALFAIVPMAILVIGKVNKLKSAFGGLFKKLTKSKDALNDSKKASENAAKGAESLKKGLNGLMKLGGIALVIASLALLAVAMQPLAKTGLKGAAAMLAFGAAVGIMAISLGLMGNRLSSGMPGILAFAGAVSVMALAMVPLANTGDRGIGAMLGFAAAISIMALALGFMGDMLTTGIVGIAVFAAAISIMALAMYPIASTGTQGAIAMAVFGAVIAGLVIVFAIFGPALTAASVGMLVFGVMAMMVGAAVLMIGIGIMIAMVGLTMFAVTLPIIAAFGMQAALAVLALGGALIVFAIGALLAGVALTVLSVGLVIFSAGLFILGAAALFAGVGLMILGVGLIIVGAGFSAVSEGILQLYNTVKTIFTDIANTISNTLNSAVDTARNVISSIGSVFSGAGNMLVNAGKAIIDGFVKGLKGAWEAGKNFIGGIGNWIKDHKGPISYDKRLLVPAGNAIMGGLNNGLSNGFTDVQSNINGITSDIANTSFSTPDIQAGMMPVNPGDLMANGFDNALDSLKDLLSTMKSADGTSLNVNENESSTTGSFDTAALVGGNTNNSTKNTNNSQVVTVQSGAIQINASGNADDGEMIARKLEAFLQDVSNGNLGKA